MRFLFLAVLLFPASFLQAQDEKCGTMYADSVLRSKAPNSPTLIDFENWLQQKMNEPSAQRGGGVITIPVIVHVVHNGDAVGTGQNISEAQVLSQFDVLNEDFRRLNADASNTPAAFVPVAADIEIEFCPAVVDPNGNVLAEPGIDRVNMTQATWSQTNIDQTLKPATIWDPTRYYNIWTVDFVNTSTLLGYAQFPEGSGLAGMPTGAQAANTDGIVCRYNAFGRTGNVTFPYDEGRTATHETGHWLGLRHIWGDGDCTVDDYCNDTPESDAANNGCLTGYVSCGGVNMVQNYMDYSNDACMNLFTICQKTRMQAVMQNSPRRAELLNSTVCVLLNQYDVTGQVRDAQMLQGVPLAKVRFKNASYNYQVDCDANGNFTINDMFEGTYTVYGGKWSYVTSSLTVSVQAGMSPVVLSVNKGYYDDFVLDFAWAVSGTATSGDWERAQPIGTTFNGIAANPGADVTNDLGTECYTTGNAGGAAGNDDVDDGTTILTSPVFDLTGYSEPYVKFYRWFFNNGGTGTPNDQLVVRITNGTTTATIETLVYNTPNANQWNFRNVRIENYVPLTANMRFILETGDLAASGHLVEAGLDLFRITDSVSTPVAEINADQVQDCAPFTVHFTDISAGNPTSWQWTFQGGTPSSSTAQNPTVVFNAPGTYDVALTATNAGGSNTVTLTDYITALENPKIINTVSDSVNCFGGADGSISLSVTQGTSPYTVTWSDGQTGLLRSSLSAGNYAATVTDNDGCKDTSATVVIVQPATALTISITSTVEYCGTQNGTATVTSSGGTAPYTVHWNTNESSSTIAGLASGNYTVTVTDAHLCQKTGSVTVGANNNPPTITLTAINASCFGENDGAITSSVSGGTTPYTYDWSNGTHGTGISGLVAAVYFLTVTDANGCVTTQLKPVTEPVAFAINDSVTNASCGLSNGAITLSVSGGIPPYTYLWANGNTDSTRINLGSGNYPVRVTDGNGCSETQTITVGQSSSLSVSNSVTNTSCGLNNGAIALSVSGGAMPYVYLWSDSSASPARTQLGFGSYVVTVTDDNGCTVSQSILVAPSSAVVINGAIINARCEQNNGAIALGRTYSYLWSTGDTASTLLSLGGGTYVVTATDTNACTAQKTFTLTTTPPVTFTLSTTDVSCFGANDGSISAHVTSGIPPFTYDWSTTDTGALLTARGGAYAVLVIDSAGCTAVEDTVINEPAELTLAVQADDLVCRNKVVPATASVNGGTPPYVIQWDNLLSGDSVHLNDGLHAAVVTDANGCTETDSFSVQALPEPQFTLQSTADTANRNTGTATATVVDGIPPFSFEWSNGQTDSIATGLAAGEYYFTLTDGNGCAVDDSVLVGAVVSVTQIGNIELAIYPNPNEGIFNIRLNHTMLPLRVEIYNVIGEQIIVIENTATTLTTVDLKPHGRGVYFIRIFVGDEVVTRKVVYGVE